MKKYIHVTKEIREHLKKVFKVTTVMVWKALTYESGSELANKIRKAAVECGGIVMNELPEMETFHDHDNYMRQYLPNGAIIEINKSNGNGEVIFRGKSVRSYENLWMRELDGIQKWAGALR